MKSLRSEAMPPDVAALLSVEKRSSVPGAAMRREIFARIEAEIGVAGLPSQPPPALPALAGIATGAALAVIGAVAVYFAAQWARPHVPPQAAPAPFVAPRAALPPLPPPVVKEAPVEPARVAVAATAAPRVVHPPPRDELLRAERQLIAVARGALAAGDPTGALDSLARHPREFPHGRLVEEREALRVVALARSGQSAEARAAADAFLARWPRSIQRAVVDAATNP